MTTHTKYIKRFNRFFHLCAIIFLYEKVVLNNIKNGTHKSQSQEKVS